MIHQHNYFFPLGFRNSEFIAIFIRYIGKIANPHQKMIQDNDKAERRNRKKK